MVAIRAGAREGVGFRTPNVRFGSKADICSAKRHVRFTPESDIKRDIPINNRLSFGGSHDGRNVGRIPRRELE
jgi:hypothetical protein